MYYHISAWNKYAQARLKFAKEHLDDPGSTRRVWRRRGEDLQREVDQNPYQDLCKPAEKL